MLDDTCYVNIFSSGVSNPAGVQIATARSCELSVFVGLSYLPLDFDICLRRRPWHYEDSMLSGTLTHFLSPNQKALEVSCHFSLECFLSKNRKGSSLFPHTHRVSISMPFCGAAATAHNQAAAESLWESHRLCAAISRWMSDACLCFTEATLWLYPLTACKSLLVLIIQSDYVVHTSSVFNLENFTSFVPSFEALQREKPQTS